MANYTDYTQSSDALIGELHPTLGYIQGTFSVGYRNSSGGAYDGAVRFTGVAINQGTTVFRADLRIYAQFQGGSQNLKFITYGIDQDNTADFSTDPFARPKTTASDSADNPLPGAGNYKQITVTSMVNEIVARGGWASGNAMGFLCEDNGTANEAYIEDDNGGAVLSILLTENSDFTPGPYNIGVGSPPDDRNFGIRISRRGFDAMHNNIQGLSLFSKAMVLKAVHDAERGWPAGSNVEAVSHGLKYAPTFLTYYKKSDKVYLTNSNDASSGLPTQRTYSDTDKITMALDPNASDLDSWYYYVFIDENL